MKIYSITILLCAVLFNSCSSRKIALANAKESGRQIAMLKPSIDNEIARLKPLMNANSNMTVNSMVGEKKGGKDSTKQVIAAQTKSDTIPCFIGDSIPTFACWQKDRDGFVKKIEENIAANDSLLKTSTSGFRILSIGGIVIGLGGGIYGLAGNSSKAASVTSLAAGALTALLATLNFDKDHQVASQCAGFLRGVLLNFQGSWSDLRYPRSLSQYNLYLQNQNDIITQMQVQSCFGVSLIAPEPDNKTPASAN